MSVFSDIRASLVSSSEITDVVGDKIRPEQLGEQDESPAITVEIDQDNALETLDAASGSERLATVGVVCWSKTRAQADEMAELVRTQLNGYRGGGIDPATFNEFERGFEPAGDDSDSGDYLTIARFSVFFRGE